MRSGFNGILPIRRRRFRNVFVLCTGRCGSLAFARACGHFTNYTAGHETNRAAGGARLVFPEFHIEVDNRLAWFLGGLEERYGDDACYVHLVRDESRVAASYDRRWHHHGSLIRAFDEGICGSPSPGKDAAGDLVATVNANIRGFLRDKTHVVMGDIEAVADWFPRFVRMIAAEGDVEACLGEFVRRHNATDEADGPDDAAARRSRASLPVAKLTEANRSLAARNARLHAEKTRLGRRLKQARRLGWALAAPWLLATAPVALPVALYALASRRLRRGATRRSGKAGVTGWRLVPQDRRTVVYDAFLTHRAAGAAEAIEQLEAAGRASPPGAIDLFRAMSAETDGDWLAATNAWAAAVDLPAITLRAGHEARFHRIEMPEAASLLAPDKVSVIMPAFNAEATIEQAARSILAQSWRNLELIIVDDASRDGTADVAARIAAGDARVKVLRNRVNVGPYVSKNRGLLAATGRYVTGHDADDIAVPSRIADQMEPIRADASCRATVASMVRVDREGRFSYPTKVGDYSYDGVARRAMISLLIERETLLGRLGFWDCVRFGADSEMLARAGGLLGEGLREVKKVVMLCLDAEGSLTNDSHFGVSAWEGVTPVRKAYREAWSAWHSRTPPDRRRLPFPHVERLFSAPAEMLVPPGALETVGGVEPAAGRRIA